MKKVQQEKNRFLINKQLYISIMFFVGLLAFSPLVFASVNNGSSLAGLPTFEPSQNPITGEWFAEFKPGKPDEIYVQLLRKPENGFVGMTFSLNNVQGLAPEIASAAKTDVNFQITREVGTIKLQGNFSEGKGKGLWELFPNPDFISAMQRGGYDNLTRQDIFSAFVVNITIKRTEDLKSLGFDRLSFEQLFKAAAFNVTPEFIRAWRSAGFQDLTFEELVKLGTFSVTPKYLNEIRAEGFPQLSPLQVVPLKIHNVTPDFIRRVRARGFSNVTPDELVDLRMHNIIR